MVIFPNVTISNLNGGRTGSGYSVTEREQWCLSTLGYVKAFSRQYASEVCFFVFLVIIYVSKHQLRMNLE